MANKEYTNPDPLNDAPSGWQVSSIEALCMRVTSGGTPLRSNRQFYTYGTIDWFKTKELKDWYIENSEEKITTEAVQKSSAKILPANTILMAMYGDGITITSLGILRASAACNQACCALIANPELCDYLFLFYALKHHRQDFLHIATGGAQRNLSGTLIKNFAIRVPSLSEQRAIAHILGSLDDKIELNRRMNATLEATARALFKSWFVDFDPVRAKMEGRQPDGMDAETAALFPDRLVESELGPIPEGWRVGRLDDLIVLQRGFDLPSDQRVPGLYPIIAASGPSGTHHEYKVEGPGVTTGRSGVLGKVFFVQENYWPLNTSLWVKEFRASRPVHAYYILTGLNFELFNAGSAVPTLNRNHVHNLPVVVPPVSVIEQFESLAIHFFRCSRQNEIQSLHLAATRDALLPKLLSGEVRVEDV